MKDDANSMKRNVKPAAPVRGLNPPLFPARRGNKTKGATMFDFYASHAPAVPDSFMPDKRAGDAAQQLERVTAWAAAYAEKMLSVRST
ncbi:hypothetical protein AW736_26310 [Termitidicoccus mucosus]|uniref:Uncharacterized protein n=1 Tax=Termitidicoccus mucosus TaxID=1184151 RepID=A0A178IRN3_9BACT|nr:hypothetical protein AW736_26310 [Opitutaceae bacterium TSB47]